jgi:hypothetical protein
MGDDRTKRGPADRSRINVGEDYEVEYWTDDLGVTRDRLREAVKAVGPSVEAVREYLGQSAGPA